MMIVENAYELGSFVYIKSDPDQQRRLIIRINVCPNNLLIYALTLGSEESMHYEMELSPEKDLSLVEDE